MSKSLKLLVAEASQNALLQTTRVIFKDAGRGIATVAPAVAATGLTGMMLGFTAEFVVTIMKSLLSSGETAKLLRRDLSKLVQEPLRTGIEQLNVAARLPEDSSEEKSHRLARFCQALESLDKALTLAEPEDRAFVQFLRGICALHIPGARREAQMHLGEYLRSCSETQVDLEKAAELHEKQAEEDERKAEAMSADPEVSAHPGVGVAGSGSLIAMAIAENRLNVTKKQGQVNSLYPDLRAIGGGSFLSMAIAEGRLKKASLEVCQPG